MRFRLLTVIMFASLLMFALKVADVIDRRQSFVEGFVVESLHAASKPKKDEAEATEKEAVAEDGTEDEEEEAETDKVPTEEEKTYTQIELDILQRLADRRTKLEEWQKDLEVKESVLNITQTKIDQKITELRELKEQVETLLAEYRQKEDDKILTLVKIYESMKPKAAAKIFTELDLDTLLQVVDKMKEKNVAAILGEMDPKLAKDLTETFAAHGRLPEPSATATP